MSRPLSSNLDEIDCTVAYPHLPENAHSASEGGDIAIDQVVIGSCTNGQIADMAAAAAVLKGRKVAPGLRAIVIPATPAVYRQCMQEGYTDIFLDAGCIVSTPTCGPCLGGYMGILAAGERCVSTTNRNFVGRMGHVESEVYLASPAVAAASAVTGHITHPKGGHGSMRAQGHVHKYGDHIDTDVIIPARYLATQDEKELASHCMEDIDTSFVQKVQPGDIMVAGWNFGCGSSREHAPIAIKASGVSCVIAKTFARIFYRNAINIGLAILECEAASNGIDDGDQVEIDFDTGVITNVTKNETYQAEPFPDFIKDMIQKGGLMASIKAAGKD